MSINFPSYATIGTTSTTVAGDSTITSVTLLLHGDGANNANNTGTFIDSSTSSFTITRAGTPTQGSVNPFGLNWSNYFNGSTGYLSITDTSNFMDLGNANASFEAWIYPTAFSSGVNSIIIKGNANSYSTTNGLEYVFGIFNGVIKFYYNSAGSGVVLTDSVTRTLNRWYHVVVATNATTITLFIDGVNTATVTAGITKPTTRTTVYIGNTQASEFFSGYMSNARFISGSGAYSASSSTFTVPTQPLTTVTNTVLLTCATNRVRDTSTVSNTITVNGSVSVQRFAPFSTSTSYSNSTTATVYSGSLYFNGSSDYLTISNYNTQFSTGNVTIEAYVYLTGSYSSSPAILDNFYKTSPYTAGSWRLEINASGQGSFYVAPGGGTTYSLAVSSLSINLNTWNHVALVRTGNSITVYLNGIGGTAVSYTGAIGTGYSLAVGAGTLPGGGAAVSQYFPGYISNPRIVGQAVYSTNFTPPTAPLTAITGTNLLLLGTNGGIIDTTMQNNLVTVGSAQISTSTVKYGSGSMYFNGSGYLSSPYSYAWILSGNFTIECWLYWSAHGSYGGIVGSANNNTGAAITSGWFLDFNSTSNNLQFEGQGSVSVVTTNPIPQNTWTHIAVVRSGSTITHYLNGVANGSGTSSQVFDSTSYPLYVGVGRDATSYLTGYIDDLRITNGVARYTANFTAPAAAFPDSLTVVSTGTYTAYVTNFTQSGQVTSSSIITTSTGGTSYYTTSTGVFTGTSVVHIFTASGFFTATQSLSVSYLVVAGGGGGGAGQNGAYGGGGGGAGGFTTGSFTATSGIIYTITVGAGGSGSPAAGTKGSNGVNSSISGTSITTITAIGGGGGGSQSNTTGNPGGSGGGSGGAAGATTAGCGTPGQGNPGSPNVGGPTWLGSGGGGAGSAATTANSNGGNGASSSITGTSFTYAGGGGSGWGGAGGTGGGGAGALSSSAVAGTNGTGGGGGAGTFSSGGAGGASGGSGIIVLSYSLSTVTTVLYTINTTTYTYNTVSSRWVVNTIPTDTSTKVITPLLLSDQANPSTGFFAVSSGTIAQRPSLTVSTNSITTGTGGRFYTTSTGVFAGTSVVHVFTSTVTSYFTASSAIPIVSYLVVAGGGGGGNWNPTNNGGGGGAGGFTTGTFTASAGITYIISVGSGGAAASSGGFSSIVSSTTVISTATGGGFGGGANGSAGPGGSGGGGAGSVSGGPAGTGVPGQGNPGGNGASPYLGGGGGGAGAAGIPGSIAGGNGTTSTITGIATIYAGGGGGNGGSGGSGGTGGGGGGSPGIVPATAGTPNTGGGGGGATGPAPTATGASGGPGIVVLSYSLTATFTTPLIGGLRYNTDVNILEITNGTTWQGVGVNSTYPVEYLVVGGGGGGGRYGGGGAGGYQNGSINVAPGTTYTVTIGAGGTGSSCVQGVRGSTSSFTGTNITSITAPGGGGGGTSCAALSPTTIGIPGGSGGGGGVVNANQSVAGGIGTLGQGNPGGTGAYPGTSPAGAAGGGGGGAGSAGTNATPTVSGPGGIGLISSINGTVTYYAGGGGGAQLINANTAGTGGLGGGGTGAKYNSATPISVAGSAGTAYTGGGGGGGYSGGSGIAIIRYPGSQRATGGSTVTTITVSGSPFTVHTFTATGAFIA